MKSSRIDLERIMRLVLSGMFGAAAVWAAYRGSPLCVPLALIALGAVSKRSLLLEILRTLRDWFRKDKN
jgi:hypothetical protein